ncbi:MAG: asparagine--tRNA ligase, partial [Ferruginibacter sp.]|nr:asparagine--tRNA ligase [Ferruginibacter sp.]
MFNTKTRIKDLLHSDKTNYPATVMGWVRTFRNNQFIALNDGSCAAHLQVVVDLDKTDPALRDRIKFGAAIGATGLLVESQGSGQKVELRAEELVIYGDCNLEEYPLQAKKQSLEFLREVAHLRFRTTTFGAIFRVRHALAYAVHQFFNNRGFFYIHSPIITGSDAEGAGEMFHVTTLPMD